MEWYTWVALLLGSGGAAALATAAVTWRLGERKENREDERADVETLQAVISELRGTITDQRSFVDRARQEVAQVLTQVDAKERRIAALEKRDNEKTEWVEQLEDRVQVLEQSERDCQNQLKIAMAKIAELGG